MKYKPKYETPHVCRACFYCIKEWGWICWNWEGKYYSQERKPRELGCHCWFPKPEKDEK